MYRYWLVFAVLCGVVISASADIYKWVDPNGVVHYSDVAGSPSAVQVQINADQVVPTSSGSAPPTNSSPGPVPSAFSNPSSPSSPPPSPQQTYTSVVITEPTDQYTYVNNESGNIVVKVTLTPSLQDGNFIQVLFDGSPVGKPQATTNLKLENVDRGEHTVQAQVLDSTGAVVATSNKVTFFLQRIRVMNRNSLNESNSINSNNSNQTSTGNTSSQNTASQNNANQNNANQNASNQNSSSSSASNQNTGSSPSNASSNNTSGVQGTEGVA